MKANQRLKLRSLQVGMERQLVDSMKCTIVLTWCKRKWRASYNAGTHIIADESMIMWVGTGDVHITYIPRKPTPLGIMLKTTVDASTGILLGLELM